MINRTHENAEHRHAESNHVIHYAGLTQFKRLPTDGKAVTQWKDEDEAWTDLVQQILELVK